MKEHVSWVNELAGKDGRLETFRGLMEEMVSETSNESGTLAYEWYISRDGSTVHVVETYADSACRGGPSRQRGVRLAELGGPVQGVCRGDPRGRLRRPQCGGPRDPRPPRLHLLHRLGRLLAPLRVIDIELMEAI